MRPVVRFFSYFFYETTVIIGDESRLSIGQKCGVANTMFNTSSGRIEVGDRTIFSHNVMVITGRHLFKDGTRVSLNPQYAGQDLGIGGGDVEVPDHGYDISIGKGCWICAGAIISGNVTIGDNVLVAANAVVTKDLPDYSVAAGVPAKVIGDTRNL
jgi:acetyltransferase-like isoleucine patch superfamily enzyme